MMTAPSWKERLYGSYVSSGQARMSGSSTGSTDALLEPRKTYIKHIISRHLPQDREAAVLDLGCGYGAFLHFLARAGYTNIAGVDTSAEQIDLAHRLGIKHAVLGDVAEYLDRREDGSLDAVLLIDVIEHLTRQETFNLLDAVYRVLAPGGVCVIHAPNAEGLFGMRIRYGDLTHEIAFTAQAGRQMLSTIGFRSVEAYEDKPLVHGAASLARRVMWDTLTVPIRLLMLAETGSRGAILSQNLLIRATK